MRPIFALEPGKSSDHVPNVASDYLSVADIEGQRLQPLPMAHLENRTMAPPSDLQIQLHALHWTEEQR